MAAAVLALDTLSCLLILSLASIQLLTHYLSFTYQSWIIFLHSHRLISHVFTENYSINAYLRA